MFISISGKLGSGKSTVCHYLKENHGFEIFSTGVIHRKLALERGLSTLEFNKSLNSDAAIDLMIDDELRKFARLNKDKNIIFDSRMAWHFVPDSFKVFLTIDPQTAADRVFSNRILEEETYASREKAMQELIDRREVENARFKTFYGVDCNDLNNFDFILDTPNLSPSQAGEAVYNAVVSFFAKK